MSCRVSTLIHSGLSKRGTSGGFREDGMHLLLERMWDQIEYILKDSPKAARQFEDCSDSKVIQSILNERTFKYHYGVGRFHMLPHSYTFADGFSLNNLLQVWVMGNQRYCVHPSRYINQNDELYCLVRGGKVLGDMK